MFFFVVFDLCKLFSAYFWIFNSFNNRYECIEKKLFVCFSDLFEGCLNLKVGIANSGNFGMKNFFFQFEFYSFVLVFLTKLH